MATQKSQQVKKESGLVAYLKGTNQELKRVTWPTKTELLKDTGVVLATIISFTILVWGLDTVLSGALGLILK
ncbi:preprotein translocase subunit SecE [Terrisporobacter sp.]